MMQTMRRWKNIPGDKIFVDFDEFSGKITQIMLYFCANFHYNVLCNLGWKAVALWVN
jgi:hypothetical protein